MDLPLDVALCIFDHLEVDDSIALSLACQGLHHHLFAKARTRFKNASNEVKCRVQTLLEKGLPRDQIYCAFCRTFHPMHWHYRQTTCLEPEFPDTCFTTRTPGGRGWKLPYLDARAVTNMGLIQSATTSETANTLEQGPWQRLKTTENGWSQWVEPKVLNDELYLRTRSRHIRRHASHETDNFTFSICKHAVIHAQYPFIWADKTSLSRLSHNTSRDRASGTCATCSADWDLRMDLIFADRAAAGWDATGWALTVTSWHRLGGVRSPDDPIWVQNAGGYATPRMRWYGGKCFCHENRNNCAYFGRLCTTGACDGRDWRPIIYADSWECGKRISLGGDTVCELGTVQRTWMESELSGSCTLPVSLLASLKRGLEMGYTE